MKHRKQLKRILGLLQSAYDAAHPVAFDHDGVNVFCDGKKYCSLEDLGLEPKKGGISVYGDVEIQGHKRVIWPLEFQEI